MDLEKIKSVPIPAEDKTPRLVTREDLYYSDTHAIRQNKEILEEYNRVYKKTDFAITETSADVINTIIDLYIEQIKKKNTELEKNVYINYIKTIKSQLIEMLDVFGGKDIDKDFIVVILRAYINKQ